MGKRVLVLNADYSAISLCSAPKAFLLVYLNKAELVAASDNATLRTVSTSYPMPSVIRLNNYVNVPYKGVVLSRQNIYKRDSFMCCYCNDTKDLTLDHVMPKSRGGGSSWGNLVTACRKCNTKKGSSTPDEAKMPLKTKPFRPSFVMFLRDYDNRAEAKWRPFLRKKGS